MRQRWVVAAFAAMSAAAWTAPSAPWVASWASAQMLAEGANVLAPADLSDATVRQIVRLSVGGSAFRLMLSNTYGTAPLHLKGVHVAKALGGDAIDPKSDRAVTFDGRSDLTIPAGGAWVSDPVDGPVAAFADLAISIHYDAAPLAETGHPGSRQTSYLIKGDHLADAGLTGAKTVDHWYQIAAIEVQSPAKAVVVLGDSITDGRGSTTNGNDRWTNVLAAGLGGHRAVLNAGIGGNCVLTQCLGPSAIARFERDVLSPAGVSDLIVLEGVNDLGSLTMAHPVSPGEHARLVRDLIAGYRQIAMRAHARGLRAYIATIAPYMGNSTYHIDATGEADRSAVNTWIRGQKDFDGIIDFDAVLRDPLRPAYLNPAYDTGDGLHPSPAGYRVMGEAAAKVVKAANR